MSLIKRTLILYKPCSDPLIKDSIERVETNIEENNAIAGHINIEGNVYTTCVECNEPVNLELKKCESCFTSIYIITLSPSKT